MSGALPPGPCCPSPESPPPDWLLASGMLDGQDDGPPLPGLDDPEGDHLPSSLPPVIDAHVHLFPDGLFEAIWRWFEAYGWPIRYKLKTPDVIDFLLSRGVEHIVALHYAHKAGLARTMNRYMAEVVERHPQVTGLATVLPGEPGARAILEEAFQAGLGGVKLHCHVQAFAADDPVMHEVYEACVDHDLPLVMHAGREPSSPRYPVDPHTLCGVERIEAVVRSYPALRLCVPHLGVDEIGPFVELVERYDNLWLDTTMVVADYFPLEDPHDLIALRPERVMYGTDFPNLPYAWDREILRLASRHDEATLAAVAGETSRAFFRVGE